MRTHRIETPEQVTLGFEVADLGSRFFALVVDLAVIVVFTLGAIFLGLWIRSRMAGAPGAQGWAAGVLTLAVFVVVWGYFTLFEALWEGRTLGKRWVGLRVIHDGGYPLTLRGSAIRNLVRLIDLQPVPTGLLGGAIMMVHPSTKRLGDLAAGTIVVRDDGGGVIPEEEWVAAADGDEPVLSDAAYEALDRYVARRGELGKAPLARLTARLEEGLAGPLESVRLPDDADAGARLAALHEEESVRRMGRGGGRASRQAAMLLRRQHGLWREYEALVRRAKKDGLQGLSERDVSRFALLYRTVAADLARVRTYGGSGELALALERLVGSGHNVFYRPGRTSWSALGSWIARGFPSLVRERWVLVALAAAALLVPAAATYGVVRADPTVARRFLPPSLIERAELSVDRLAAGERYVDVPGVGMPILSSNLMVNNIQVTFLVFAGGILAGVGSLYVLALNGVMIGAALALYDSLGTGSLIWGFVAPHGVTELSAIVIAGAAGIRMGSALVVPGRETRAVALARRAREAVSLLAGTSVLLVVAGAIEGFVSPAPIPVATRMTVAALAAAAVVLYLTLAGRSEGRSVEAEALRSTPGTSPPGTG